MSKQLSTRITFCPFLPLSNEAITHLPIWGKFQKTISCCRIYLILGDELWPQIRKLWNFYVWLWKRSKSFRKCVVSMTPKACWLKSFYFAIFSYFSEFSDFKSTFVSCCMFRIEKFCMRQLSNVWVSHIDKNLKNDFWNRSRELNTFWNTYCYNAFNNIFQVDIYDLKYLN